MNIIFRGKQNINLIDKICLCLQSSSYATATVHLNTGVFLLERAGNQNLWLKVDESKVSGGNMSADVAR